MLNIKKEQLVCQWLSPFVYFSLFNNRPQTMTRRMNIIPKMPAVTRKSRPGRLSAEMIQSLSKTGTKARGIRASSRVTKVFNFPSSEDSTTRAIIILQTGGSVPVQEIKTSKACFFLFFTAEGPYCVAQVECKFCFCQSIPGEMD